MEEAKSGQIIDRIKRSSVTRYVLIGGSAFVIDYSLLHFFLSFEYHILIANGIATATALTYSFILHRGYTFINRARSGKGYQLQRQYQAGFFTLISVISLLLSEAIIYGLTHQFRLEPGTAKVITSALLFFWSYFAHRILTFRVR